MWAAQVVALNCPEAIRYRAWNRSRVRRCGSRTEASRRSASVWPHLAMSTQIIGRLRGGGWPGCPRSQAYLLTPERKLPVSSGAGFSWLSFFDRRIEGAEPDPGIGSGEPPPHPDLPLVPVLLPRSDLPPKHDHRPDP